MAGEGGVAAVHRALSILDAFTEADQKLSLAELAKRTGLYKSTLLRLAKSLEKFGYLIRSDDGSYHLGSKVLFLGSLVSAQLSDLGLRSAGTATGRRELHEGASFYVRDEEQRVCLHRIDAHRAVRDSVHEGDRSAVHRRCGRSRPPRLQWQNRCALRRDKENMYAASYGERDPETAAIACPVFGLDQKFVGALSVSGPRYRIEELGTKRVLPVLFKHAHALTRTLGGDPEVPAFATWLKGRKSIRADAKAPAKKYSAASQKRDGESNCAIAQEAKETPKRPSTNVPVSSRLAAAFASSPVPLDSSYLIASCCCLMVLAVPPVTLLDPLACVERHVDARAIF